MRHAVRFSPPLVAALLSILPLTSLTAQVVRGGDLVTTNYGTPAAVFRVDHTGAVTTLLAGAPLAGPAGVTVLRSRDILVADFTSNSLVRIDAQTGLPTVVAGGLGGPLRLAEMADGDYVVTSNSGHSLLRVTPAGLVTTLASGPLFNRPFGVSVDANGDLLVADDLGRAIHRVTPAGVITPIYSGLPLRLPQGVALFPNGDYAVIDGLTDSVFRIDRSTNAITTWVPNAALAVNPEGIVPDWSGGFFISNSQASGSGIAAIDALGSVTTAASGAPFTNLEDVARVPFVRGPRTLSTGPGGLASFDLDAPAQVGQLYSLVLSLSVFPGWQLPGDPRAMTINVDAFFLATIGRNSPPALVGWTAPFDPAGRGTATVDMRWLPTGALLGLSLYQQGVTITNRGTAGTLLNPLRLDFQ